MPPSGPPGPQHIVVTATDVCTGVFGGRLVQAPSPTLSQALLHVMNNQTVVSHQVARLDSASLAAQAGEHAAQAAASAKTAKSKAKLVSSAAELSAEVGANARPAFALLAPCSADRLKQCTPAVHRRARCGCPCVGAD